jgi:hypothetical protein
MGMNTFVNRGLRAALFGSAILVFQVSAARAQMAGSAGAFRVAPNGNMAMGGGASGVSTVPQFRGAMNNPYGGGALPGVGNFFANPYGVGTMTSVASDPYGGGTGNAHSPYPYNPYGSMFGDPFGGYLNGAASVIGSQGQFMVQRQQAEQIKEQIRQQKIMTRRAQFDEWLYERANTPTLEQERERSRLENVARSRNDPPLTEIWSAKALNDLLTDIQKLQARNVRGPQVILDEDVLKKINVTSGKSNGNVGVLKSVAEGRRLNWPLALLDLQPAEKNAEMRKEAEALAQEAVQQAINGKPDANILKQLNGLVKEMNGTLQKNSSEITPSQYIEAKRFLNNFGDALEVLRQPEAGNYFTQKYAAKGRTVNDLVKYMTEQGLQFAPAVSGEEAAYVSLQRAMANYSIATQGLVAESPR